MAETLGFLAGCGMLALVGWLFVSFLLEMRWISWERTRLIGRTALMTCGAGVLYLLVAAVHFLTVYQTNLAGLSDLFRGPYMTGVFQALTTPRGVDACSLVFVGLAHGLGAVLFRQFELSGLWLAWVLTGAGLYLIQLRLEKKLGEKTAFDLAFLLLCLPGSVFLLLPGCAPFVFFLLALSFFFLGKHLPYRSVRLHPTAYGWAVALCALFSAAITTGMVTGAIG